MLLMVCRVELELMLKKRTSGLKIEELLRDAARVEAGHCEFFLSLIFSLCSWDG